jgi:hypothetical protein
MTARAIWLSDLTCVPVLPAAALLRKLLLGPAEPGARIADAALSLDGIEAEMRAYAITTSRSVMPSPEAALADA